MFVYNRYTLSDFALVRHLSEAGLSDYEVGRRTSVPRATVQDWRKRSHPPRGLTEPRGTIYEPANVRAYSYLLGCYLGDGTISQTGQRTWRLAIFCDRTYPAVTSEVAGAVQACAAASPVRLNDRSDRGVTVVCASSHLWPAAFPQLGPGRKHERDVSLRLWQLDITTAHPREFLRGLVHSDGCRTINTFKTKLSAGRIAQYSYPRYFFTNLSAQIRCMFCAHAELIGVRWTQSNPRNISISHRDSVALLDGFIGPKS